MHARGFTLIETVIAVLVMGILLACALPGFTRVRNNMVQRKTRAQVTQDLRLARQIAVTRRAPVVIQFGDGVNTHDLTYYALHVDTNGDLVKQSGESVSNKPLPLGVTLSDVSMTPRDSLIFDITGDLWPGTRGGTLVIRSANGRTDTLRVASSGLVFRS
ncbi:MAG TPA: type II secretion system protein [Dongiaceae bacterium]|nr:type II secretion system protein [Dongiaceae bacterium]